MIKLLAKSFICSSPDSEIKTRASSRSCPAPAITSKKEALELLNLGFEHMLKQACLIREHYFGNKISVCAIINAKSGNCGMDCKFCAQSSHNTIRSNGFNLLSNHDLLARIKELEAYPLNNIGIVTSGGALNNQELTKIADFIGKNKFTKTICTSLGRLSKTELACLQSAGVTRYHHNLESSKNHYPKLCTTQNWQERLATVKAAKSLGLELCCGGIFGTGETWEDRIDFALTLANENISNIPINFFHPQPNTPLEKTPLLSSEEALSIIALFRHILPTATLRICGGRTFILKDKGKEVFAAGANAIMTGDYLTTSGASIKEDLKMLEELGLKIE